MSGTSKHGLGRPLLGYFTLRPLEESPDLRKHLVAAGGELIGTFLFLFGEYGAKRRCCPSKDFEMDSVDANTYMAVCCTPSSRRSFWSINEEPSGDQR